MKQPEPQDADAWFERGKKLYWKEKNYEESLSCFNRVIELIPKKYEAWNYCGNALRKLGRYQEAIASFDKALEIKPDYYQAWNNRGLALSGLERYQDAIESYNKALIIKKNYYQARNNRGNALRSLQRYNEAITSYDRALEVNNQYWRAWRNRGWAFFYSSRYEEALKNWDNGLQQIKPRTRDYAEGCGELHDSKGLAQYLHGLQQGDPFPDWLKAERSYQEALKFLTFEKFPERHLEVLQILIKVCRGLSKKDEAQMLESEGSEFLGRLLQDKRLDTEKIRLARKFAAFNQYRVDSLAESGNWNTALELAEQRKNLCLRWLRYNRWVDSTDVGTSLPMPFLNSQTAVVYWHISPAAITTFIVKHEQPLIVLQPQIPRELQQQNYPAYLYQLYRFETWMQQWKQNYKDYRQNFTSKAKETALWWKNMEKSLNELHNILDIDRIKDYLQDINNLILIPHRELHLLPLDYLFPERFTITYLPSFEIGKQLQFMEIGRGNEFSIPSLLKVESMNNAFAIIESTAISWLYTECNSLQLPVKQEALIAALCTNTGYFHFTGHAYHVPEHPRQSALLLAEPDKLTLGEVFDNEQLDLKQYQLICLAACETGITSRDNLVDEYVGLVSGFLAKGASYVVSSLWEVDDRSTALLMIKFYQLLKYRETPATALKQAKDWLRQLTYEALAKWYRSLAQQLDDSQCREYLKTEALIIENAPDKMTSTEPVYAHPYYWAGFILTGNPA